MRCEKKILKRFLHSTGVHSKLIAKQRPIQRCEAIRAEHVEDAARIVSFICSAGVLNKNVVILLEKFGDDILFSETFEPVVFALFSQALPINLAFLINVPRNHFTHANTKSERAGVLFVVRI